jgi:hypothetical protein
MNVMESSVIWDAESQPLLRAGFLLGLFFNPEDGGDAFPKRKLSLLPMGYKPLYPRNRNLHNRRCENMKSYMPSMKANLIIQSSYESTSFHITVLRYHFSTSARLEAIASWRFIGQM